MNWLKSRLVQAVNPWKKKEKKIEEKNRKNSQKVLKIKKKLATFLNKLKIQQKSLKISKVLKNRKKSNQQSF